MSKVQGHPYDNPALPSFIHPDLAEHLGELAVVQQCWELLRKGDAKERHLPKEPGEPKKAYENRLQRSSYSSFFRDAIVAYAGSLSRFDVNQLPPSMAAVQRNIDNQASSLASFLAHTDSLMLRDGGCLVMVDAPNPGKQLQTLGQQQQLGQRPYVTAHSRMNLRNWKTIRRGGVEIVQRLTIAEVREKDDGGGFYGTEYEQVYRVIEGGTWRLVRLEQDGQNGYVEEQIDEGVFLDPAGNVMETPPVFWYSAMGRSFGTGDLPLLSLANLTLDHFREYSDWKELLHLTALITPVRKGVVGTGPIGPDGRPTTPALTIGPHSGQDLPADGSFDFAEVEGSSLDKHKEHLAHIETLIDRQTLSFLFSGAQETATQALLETAQMQATLASIGERKTAMARQLIELWCRFTTEDPDPEAGIRLREGVFDKPLGTPELKLVQDLWNDRLLSRKSALWLINKAGLLPPEVGPEDEGQRLDDEEPDRPELPSVAEFGNAPEGVDPLAGGRAGLPRTPAEPAATGG